jgi:hypothetical protein
MKAISPTEGVSCFYDVNAENIIGNYDRNNGSHNTKRLNHK